MSKAAKRWVCKRKEAFSKTEANEMLVKRYATKGYAGQTYLFEVCGWWHLTKKLNEGQLWT